MQVSNMLVCLLFTLPSGVDTEGAHVRIPHHCMWSIIVQPLSWWHT